VARPVGGADKRVVANKRGMRQPCGGSVLKATLERITFANPDTGYTVGRVGNETPGHHAVRSFGAVQGRARGNQGSCELLRASCRYELSVLSGTPSNKPGSHQLASDRLLGHGRTLPRLITISHLAAG